MNWVGRLLLEISRKRRRKIKVGDVVRHTVGDYSKVLTVTRISDGLVFFDDRTHAELRKDMSWLVPVDQEGHK